jgi:hypothetical protein
MSNPYASPSQPQEQGKSADSDVNATIARLSWKVPLVGFSLSILLSALGLPIAMIASVLFVGSVAVGLLLAVIALTLSPRRWRVARSAICGLVVNSLLVVPILVGFTVVSQSQDTATESRDKQGSVNRMQGSTPFMSSNADAASP